MFGFGRKKRVMGPMANAGALMGQPVEMGGGMGDPMAPPDITSNTMMPQPSFMGGMPGMNGQIGLPGLPGINPNRFKMGGMPGMNGKIGLPGMPGINANRFKGALPGMGALGGLFGFGKKKKQQQNPMAVPAAGAGIAPSAIPYGE